MGMVRTRHGGRVLAVELARGLRREAASHALCVRARCGSGRDGRDEEGDDCQGEGDVLHVCFAGRV